MFGPGVSTMPSDTSAKAMRAVVDGMAMRTFRSQDFQPVIPRAQRWRASKVARPSPFEIRRCAALVSG